MLNLLLNYSPAFVIGELMLALSLGLFGVALVGAVRDRYSVRVPVARIKGPIHALRSTRDAVRFPDWNGARFGSLRRFHKLPIDVTFHTRDSFTRTI